jgi:hypothetical protein
VQVLQQGSRSLTFFIPLDQYPLKFFSRLKGFEHWVPSHYERITWRSLSMMDLIALRTG